MKDKKITKFEFLLTLEDHIICQRFFNVRGFRPSNIKSLDLYDVVNNIKSEINDSLKEKASDYLMSLYNTYSNSINLPEQDRNNESNENFYIYIKLNNRVVTQRVFPAWIYPGKIRYTVDVRPFISSFLKDLSDTLSARKVERKYLETIL